LGFRAKTQRRQPAAQWSKIKLLDEFSPWVITCLRKIASFSELEQGWDSYGSDRIQPAAVVAATRFVAEIPLDRVPEASVSPVPGGGIGLHWKVADRDLEIEFLPNGTAEYLKIAGGKSEEGTLSDFADRSLWSWLAGEPF
jgi:hypothetical protein